MTSTQEKILEVFKEFKIAINGILNPQSLNSRIRTWGKRSQDESTEAIKQLITGGYISSDDKWYILLEKGYNYIFRNYSIEDTEQLILDVFRKHKIGVGEILMQNSFLSFRQEAERFHFENFNNAILNLHTKRLIESSDMGYKLTQAGYERIY